MLKNTTLILYHDASTYHSMVVVVVEVVGIIICTMVGVVLL
jgi:hypothetical protein